LRSRIAGAAVALALLALLAGTAAAEDIAVIVNPDVPVTELSQAELRKIMLGDRQFWPGGQRVALIVRAPVAEERTVLLQKIYEMSEAQYRQYWIAKVFRAEATDGLRVVVSNEKIMELVEVIPGAIAFVSANDVPAGARILRIDGAVPGDENYPIR
jgi:ABC-type phosphate transport system substrate-binding protein